MIDQMIQDFLNSVQRGTVIFLGLLCFLVFAANAVLLFMLLMKKGQHSLARCPRCGRQIACPHCAEDEPEPTPKA